MKKLKVLLNLYLLLGILLLGLSIMGTIWVYGDKEVQWLFIQIFVFGFLASLVYSTCVLLLVTGIRAIKETLNS